MVCLKKRTGFIRSCGKFPEEVVHQDSPLVLEESVLFVPGPEPGMVLIFQNPIFDRQIAFNLEHSLDNSTYLSYRNM